MRISHPTLRLRIAAAACVASSPNMIDRANCSGCSCSVRLHHAALPPPMLELRCPTGGRGMQAAIAIRNRIGPGCALQCADAGCGGAPPWRGRAGGEVEMRLRRATAACEGWPPMEGGAHGAGPVLLRPRTKKALSGSVMGNYGRRGGVNKGLECVIAFAIVLVQSPSLSSFAGIPTLCYDGLGN